jgi:arginine decarboxylase-like protein
MSDSSASPQANQGQWDIPTARTTYNIDRWGAGYFDINEEGHVIARPLQDHGASVDLMDVVEEAKGRALKFPLLIRFQDILRHRVQALNEAFRHSIAEFSYQGKYEGCFPSRSINCAKWLRRFWRQESRINSDWRLAASGVVRRDGVAGPAGQPDHLQRL